MVFSIEKWAESNLSENGVALLNESIKCYKVGAYRSSFIMSYLAFKVTIKDRIINASKPDNITEICWNNEVVGKLKQDSQWEEKVNCLIDQSVKNGSGLKGVFCFSNDETVKHRYAYWKSIRNSCAHARNEHITAATVEQFWNYMMDDSPEYYVLGGKAFLSKQITEIFKYFYSYTKEELYSLLNQVEQVFGSSVKDFFKGFFAENPSATVLNKKNRDFWEIVINHRNDKLRDGFIDYFYQEKMEQFFDWYSEFPQLFSLLMVNHREFIQKVVSPVLEKGWYIEDKVFWSLLVRILVEDNRLIDIQKVTSCYDKFRMIDKIQLNEYEMNVLYGHNIFNKFLYNAGGDFFRNSGSEQWDYYSYGSGKNDIYIEKCFEYIKWDIELINKINSACNELMVSIMSRSNSGSKANGEVRLNLYRTIINSYAHKIEEVLNTVGKTYDDFAGIKNLLKEVNIVS